MNIWEWAGVSLVVLIALHLARWLVRRVEGYRHARVIARVSRRIQR